MRGVRACVGVRAHTGILLLCGFLNVLTHMNNACVRMRCIFDRVCTRTLVCVCVGESHKHMR